MGRARTNRNFSQHIPYPLDYSYIAPALMLPENAFVRHLTLNGDGSTIDMVVDGSVTPQSFRVVCPTDKVITLDLLELHIIDAGLNVNEFGALPALTNGCVMNLRSASDEILSVLSASPVKNNLDLNHLGSVDVQIGGGQDAVWARWDISKTFGYRIILEEGQYVEWLIRDNMAGIEHFEGTVHGRLVDDD